MFELFFFAIIEKNLVFCVAYFKTLQNEFPKKTLVCQVIGATFLFAK